MSIYEEWEMQCPRCGGDEQISIEVKMIARLRYDGTDISDSDHEWGDDSPAACGDCGYSGTVADFEAVSVIEKAFQVRISTFHADLKSGKITEARYEKLRKSADDEKNASIHLLRLIHDAPDKD